MFALTFGGKNQPPQGKNLNLLPLRPLQYLSLDGIFFPALWNISEERKV
jgi:hypothetical protein